jgi:hypothetical protein
MVPSQFSFQPAFAVKHDTNICSQHLLPSPRHYPPVDVFQQSRHTQHWNLAIDGLFFSVSKSSASVLLHSAEVKTVMGENYFSLHFYLLHTAAGEPVEFFFSPFFWGLSKWTVFDLYFLMVHLY